MKRLLIALMLLALLGCSSVPTSNYGYGNFDYDCVYIVIENPYANTEQDYMSEFRIFFVYDETEPDTFESGFESMDGDDIYEVRLYESGVLRITYGKSIDEPTDSWVSNYYAFVWCLD